MAQTFFYSTGTFVVPTGVTSVQIEAWGGGGGGGTRTTSNGGGGGGGGAYSKTNSVTVTPGNSYTVTVGAGAGAGSNGGDSWMSTTGVAPTSTSEGALAKGGTGVATNVTTGGTGGLASAGFGDTKYNGGTGGTSAGNGAGGGGGAGDAGDGGNGSDAAAGTAGSVWGGAGGAIQTGNADGNSGEFRGGGGGGARRTSGTRTGGSGNDGMVIVTYTPTDSTTIYPNGDWSANYSSGTTVTVAVKAPGTNVAGIAIVECADARSITGVTWDGVAMTNEGNSTTGGGTKLTLFSIPNPASGVVNVVATIDSAATVDIRVLSYVGVDQSDVVTEVVTGNTFAASLTLTGMTPNRAGCWGVAGFYSAGGGATSGTNFVRRSRSGDPVAGDTDGAESADFEMTSSGNSGTYVGIGAVISPAMAATSASFLMFM